MNGMKIVRLATWGLILLLVTVTGWVIWSGQRASETLNAGAPAIGGPFTLVDTGGRTVDQTIFAGAPHAIFFGFTTLGEMTLLLQELGPDGDKLKIAFVTVDPERDDPALLKDYLTAFDPRIIGLTGSEAQVAEAVEAYRVYRRKVPTEGDDYTMDHTASVFLFDADGAFRGTIAYGEPQSDALAKLKRLVAG